MKKYTMSAFLRTRSFENMTLEELASYESTLAKNTANLIQNELLTHSIYGTGKVVAVESTTSINNMYVKIQFRGGAKLLTLTSLKFKPRTDMFGNTSWSNAEVHRLFNDAFGAWEELLAARAVIEQELKAKAALAEAAAAAQAKAEAAYEAHKAKTTASFDELVSNTFEKVDSEELWQALGWLVANLGSVSASVPEYLEQDFHKAFGARALVNVVDSRKKAFSGGILVPASWTLKVTLTKTEGIPSYLEQYLSASKKHISDDKFVCNLVKNYKFKFGSKQDKNAIRNAAPEEFREAFDNGFKSK